MNHDAADDLYIPVRGGTVRIDASDASLLNGRRWYVRARPTGRRRVGASVWLPSRQINSTVDLARLILGLDEGDPREAIHLNYDPLDCRRGNLRAVEHSDVLIRNQKRRTRDGVPCTSAFIGVTFERQTGKWKAQIATDGKNRWLGRYSDEVEAALAWDRAARECKGPLVRLNFPAATAEHQTEGATV